MNRLQTETITRHRRAPQWGVAILAASALLIACLAIAATTQARDAQHAALRQANEARRELREVVTQINAVNARQRQDLDASAKGLASCHKRVDLVIEAVDVVAKTCPGRFRAPMSLDRARRMNVGGNHE